MIESLLIGYKHELMADKIFTPIDAATQYNKLGYLFLPNGLFSDISFSGLGNRTTNFMKLNLRYLFDFVTGAEYGSYSVNPKKIA
ncbi:MAG TPA: hypothetical protein VEC16_00360, partial [Alphaproteobacteria bacterium]|nr:hypothetical protein [Alphaproteobacteria bacterium]